MKQKNKVLISTLSLMGGAFVGILPAMLLSKKCGKTTDDKVSAEVMKDARRILEIKKESEEALQKANIYLAGPTKEEAQKAAGIVQEYLDKIKTEFSHYLGEKLGKDINSDVLAWIKGIQYNLELQKSSFTSGIRYLLGRLDWGPSSSYLTSGYYGLTPEPYDKTQAERWLATLKEAVSLEIVPSKVFIKNTINSLVNSFLENEGTKETLDKFIKETTPQELKLTELIDKLNVDEKIKEFYKYYVTDYYKASKYGLGENTTELKLTKTNNSTSQEIENTLYYGTTPLYGLGLTEKDLTAEKVGIGHMPVSEEAKKQGVTGQTIYRHMLKMCTTSDLSDQQVFEKGYKTSHSAAENMKEIANKVATLITGDKAKDWKPKIRYDATGGGSIQEVTVNVRVSGKVDLAEFSKWLNDEAFFFGREKKEYYTDERVKELLNGDHLKPARAELKKFGYDDLIKDETTKKQTYRGITNEQFYYGALEGFKAYYQFKEQTQKYGQTFFDKIVPDYGVQTYEYKKRNNSGVGAYDSSIRNFMFNCDPYYGLQKWSVTSFANHESMMGHHNQLMYAEHHLKKLKDKNNQEVSLPVNTFNYTAYLEGWALFMEWFGIETKFYGTPDYASKNLDSLPVDFGWDKSYGITSFLKNAKVNWNNDEDVKKNEDVKKIKELHGGIYWDKINEAEAGVFKTEAAKVKATAELINMLQYFGALNEAQLRNMRLLIDTGYHGGEVTGVSDVKGGMSIKQAREYMLKNSALGAGDRESESKRYLNFVGQATAYNSGKEILKDLYEEVRGHLKLSREQFVNHNNHEHPKKFFDIVLRNSALPLDAVAAIVRAEYGITKK
ncbi:hypothetical protein NPL1_01100 [Metamycoplasma hyosynoviae]|uniref:DUF885 family protein n=1 Tax=Metamycoplasma hyosynoviae TaxID=29559 RepID=UPI0004610488|nr:DUF885 family protein [Metamycoplasma hyosynoviae]KDE43391.1 hypothetical protein NPL1_01100 [Metamycoplasma hyosynoviae]